MLWRAIKRGKSCGFTWLPAVLSPTSIQTLRLGLCIASSEILNLDTVMSEPDCRPERCLGNGRTQGQLGTQGSRMPAFPHDTSAWGFTSSKCPALLQALETPASVASMHYIFPQKFSGSGNSTGNKNDNDNGNGTDNDNDTGTDNDNEW